MNNYCNDKSTIAWAAEYKKQGIPSSFRKEPTRAVTEFTSWIGNKDMSGNVAVDLGCGRGRNSFYLANCGFSVTAIDLLQENADAINEQAMLLKLPIHAIAQDVSEQWPIAPHSLDIAIDVFCYKHITCKQAQKNYRNELWKALQPNGFYFISLASVHDGFYGPLLVDSPSLGVALNIPYTKKGNFSCIDTEYPKRNLNLNKIKLSLSPENQVYWDDLILKN